MGRAGTTAWGTAWHHLLSFPASSLKLSPTGGTPRVLAIAPLDHYAMCSNCAAQCRGAVLSSTAVPPPTLRAPNPAMSCQRVPHRIGRQPHGPLLLIASWPQSLGTRRGFARFTPCCLMPCSCLHVSLWGLEARKGRCLRTAVPLANADICDPIVAGHAFRLRGLPFSPGCGGASSPACHGPAAGCCQRRPSIRARCHPRRLVAHKHLRSASPARRPRSPPLLGPDPGVS